MSDDQPQHHGNGVSTREHVEVVVFRVEQTLKQQIDGLRSDIEMLQRNYVTRAEFDSVRTSLQREIDRVERQGADRMREVKDDIATRLSEFKTDVTKHQERSLVIIGMVMTLVSFVVQMVVNLRGGR